MKDVILFWFGNSGVAAYLKYLTLLSDYAGFAKFEISKNGPHFIITAYLSLGEKWSSYSAEFLREGTEEHNRYSRAKSSKSELRGPHF